MFRPRRLIPVAAAVASLLATAAPAGAHYENPGSKYCGYVVFERNTDSGASGIESKGVSCRKAKSMVRAVRRGNMRPFGIRCKARDHEAANFIAHSDIRCKSGGRVVTWIAT